MMAPVVNDAIGDPAIQTPGVHCAGCQTVKSPDRMGAGSRWQFRRPTRSLTLAALYGVARSNNPCRKPPYEAINRAQTEGQIPGMASRTALNPRLPGEGGSSGCASEPFEKTGFQPGERLARIEIRLVNFQRLAEAVGSP